MMDFGAQFKIDRDRKLRGEMLKLLEKAKGRSPMDGLTGDTLVEVISSAMVGPLSFEDDAHAMGLLVDLANKALITLKRHPRGESEPPRPKYCFAKITDKGSQLLRWRIPADADVADGRAPEEA